MLNIILAALPALGSLVSSGKADAVISAGTKIAKEVFGTTDEVSIAKAIETNPALAEQFKARLEAETANLAAQLADVQDARASAAKLAEMGHPGYWSGPIIDVVVVLGFFIVLGLLVLRPVTMDQTQFAVANILLGTLGTSFVQIVNFHRGSSAGSASKDITLKQIARAK